MNEYKNNREYQKIQKIYQQKKTIKILIIFILIISIMLLLVTFAYIFKPESARTVEAFNEIESEINELSEKNEQLKSQLESAEKENSELKSQLEQITIENSANTEMYEQELSKLRTELEELKKNLSEETENIQNENDEEKDTLSDDDKSKASSKAQVIFAGIPSSAPKREVEETVEKETVSEDGTVTVEEVEEKVEKEAKISIYYEDLTTGFSFGYNQNNSMYSASLIKAPYILSVLEEVSQYQKANGTVYPEGKEKYDLNRKWVFDKENMNKNGSGKIKDMEDGTEMTYKDLVSYALMYSDNVAFAQLRETFGYGYFNSYAQKIGASSVLASFYSMSPADAGKFLRCIYDFTESDAAYGSFMKECMMNSSFRAIIDAAVYPKKNARKYGWDIDSYHDMAIVYDEHPYIIVVMTDYDDGGDEVNSYLRSIVKQIDKIHTDMWS